MVAQESPQLKTSVQVKVGLTLTLVAPLAGYGVTVAGQVILPVEQVLAPWPGTMVQAVPLQA